MAGEKDEGEYEIVGAVLLQEKGHELPRQLEVGQSLVQTQGTRRSVTQQGLLVVAVGVTTGKNNIISLSC